MSLQKFYADIGPYLLGQQSHAETVQRLYGTEASGRHQQDAARLEIYRRFCRSHRHEALDFVFVHCRAVVINHGGEAAWAALVDRYFIAQPMHHFELNQNGAHFPAFVTELAAAGELPPFVGELADFEWWEWLVETAPDAAAPPPSPLPQLDPSVELRAYQYDLVGWIDDDAGQPAAPAAVASWVLFWRDRELRGRRAATCHIELMVIKAVVEQLPLDAALADRIGVGPAALQASVAELLAAGILRGS